MNGREVFKFAVRIMGDASTRVVDKAGLTSDDIDLFIPHHKYSHYGICEREIGYRKEKMSVSVNKYGNTSAASILKYQSRVTKRKIKDDDTLVLVGFGGGLTWAQSLSNGENRG